MVMNMENFGLPPSAIELIRDVFAGYAPVTEVLVYGSRAKGTFGAGSDIDLSIMDGGVTPAQLLRIENDLDQLPLPYSVDLSLFRRIDNPALTDHILRVGKIFYRAKAAA